MKVSKGWRVRMRCPRACLRRSEVAALTWGDVEPATTPGALRIHVRSSKTDQAGERADVRLVKNGVAKALLAIKPVLATAEVTRSGGWRMAAMVAHYAAGVTAESNATAKYL